MPYKKKSSQQYALKRKKALAKVQTKLKKAGASKKKKAETVIPAQPPAKPAEEATEAPLPKGRKATLHFKAFGLNIKANVRYETEKVVP